MVPLHPPDAPAVISPAGAITWAEWDLRIDAAVERLHETAPHGGIVAFVADDRLAAGAFALAALRAGVTVAPVSPKLPPSARADVVRQLGAGIIGGAEPADPEALPAGIRGAGGVVVHTSGSMGEPKAALLTAESLVTGALGLVEAFDLRAGDTWLLDLPLYHVAGLGVIVRCALAGAAFAVPDSGWATTRAIRELGVTHASLVGTQLYRLLRDDPAPSPAQLRVTLLGGGPASPAQLDEAIGRGWPVANSYGLTEMGSAVTATRAGARDHTAGAPLPGRLVRVVDNEIRVGGEGLFAGYLAGGELDRPLDAEGLFRTGDLGSIDVEGRLTITGRVDNRFISGGENVQPEEVEAALASLPGIIRAVVVPAPDAEFGHRGVAFVETSDGTLPDEDTLAGALVERIERLKIPVRFLPWPAGDVGFKPSRRELERLAAEAMGDE